MVFKQQKLPALLAAFTMSFAVTLAVSCGDINAMAKTSPASSMAIGHTRHLDSDGKPLFSNRLTRQDSLYLQQHAHNPVDWWPWGDEAFERARKLDKPVLLSIGYSTCHWCHVMARESFEDPIIAKFINENFIPIKVDREERPDIDELYITAVQMLSGKAGWPLTAVLTPDALPFFGGTYFPPDQFLGLLNKISDTWVNRRAAVMEQAERLKGALDKVTQSAGDAKALNDAFIENAQQRIQQSLSAGEPDIGSAFPREPEMLFLLDQALGQLDGAPLAIVQQRLQALAAGGIHDHLGGGFHRYSVDADWQIPHFEKMLYNQAQLGQLYALVTMFTRDPQMQEIAESTLDFILRDMQSPDGGFYAAIDAESDGREGTYYVWTDAELQQLLSETEMRLARRSLGISVTGNFDGSNVLHRPFPVAETSNNVAPPNGEIAALLQTLLQARLQRTPPHTDTKIITAWNAMAISALLAGYRTLGNEIYLEAAVRASETIWNQAWSRKKGLARTIPGAGKPVAGSLEDYAYFARSLLDLYDLNHEQVWLQRATQLTNQMIDRFYDADSGGFLLSSNKNKKQLIVALVSARDDAINSGNSVAAQLLARLYRRTGDIEYRRSAQRVLAAFSGQLLASPQSLSGMLVAASLLSRGELGQTQYGANGKVRVTSNAVDNRLLTTIDIAPGWHINSWRVLEPELIPTALTPLSAGCATVESPVYPEDMRVSLGFQEDELLVFKDQVLIQAAIKQPGQSESPGLTCKLLAAELRFQACSDEVCLAPENLKIRVAVR